MESLLRDTPLPIIAVALFMALLGARELGAALARRVSPVSENDTEGGYVLSGVLGLLALLVAFTFGMALNRYEMRRELVVAEANAIGTAEMRVRLLDAPYAAHLSEMLRSYARMRLDYGLADVDAKPPLQVRSAAMRDALQAETLKAVAAIRTTPLAAMVVPAINETLDIGAAREAAHDARLPTPVLWMLLAYVVITAGVMGAVLGRGRNRHPILTGLMFLLLSMALALILDLDRPQSGSIHVSQTPMARLVDGFRRAPAVPSGQPSAASPPSLGATASEDASGSSPP